jgi:DNA-damage-inducible protein J
MGGFMRVSKGSTEVVSVRIDGRLKRSTQRILSRMGISMTDAIRVFLKQVDLHKGLPFPAVGPNAETIAAMREARDPSKLKCYTSFQEILDER